MFARLTTAFVLAAVATSCAMDDEAPSQEDLDSIHSVIAQELAAVNAGDGAGFIAILTSDAAIAAPNQPTVEGAAARTWINDFINQITVSMPAYTNEVLEVFDDVAIHRYDFSWSVTPKAGGATMSESGRGIHILRRQADGSWKLAYDLWNSDTPLPEMMPEVGGN